MGQQGMAFYGVSCNESLSFIWDLEILENFKTCNLISSKHFFPATICRFEIFTQCPQGPL